MSDTSAAATRYVEVLERRDWEAFAALLHADVRYRLPQTGEAVVGRVDFVRFNQEYPGDWHLTVKRVIAEGDSAVAWVTWRVGDTSETGDAVVFLEYDERGLVTSVTDFWPESYDPPPGREHLVEPR